MLKCTSPDPLPKRKTICEKQLLAHRQQAGHHVLRRFSGHALTLIQTGPRHGRVVIGN
jgi:hypothetical protein